MKYLILAPFALLLGLAAGSWAPHREMVELRRENKNLKKELDASGRGSKLAALDSLITIPGKATGRRVSKARDNSDSTDSSVASEQRTEQNLTNATVSASSPQNSSTDDKRRRRRFMPSPRSKNFEAELEEAKELWQTRVEMARSQWLAKLELDAEQSELFDSAFADMNEKLYLTMQLVADELKAGSEMTNEAGLRIVNEVTATLVETYDQLDQVVSPDRRPELESMEIQDFIDPAAFEPLIDVRDRL